MSGPVSNNLREKFKLLRQWQMQQQEHFLRKQMEHAQIFENQKKPAPASESVDLEEEIVAANARYQDDTEDKIQENHNYSNSFDEAENTNQSEFLQRMSQGSLQRALSDILDGLKSENAEDADLNSQESDIKSDDENSEEIDKEEEDASAGNMWNNSSKMQTVVLKSKTYNETPTGERDALSAASSFAESLHELEGVYPIVYSEDNVSENENTESDLEDKGAEKIPNIQHENDKEGEGFKDDLPFDEIPAKSQLGNEVSSFEELIEKQLRLETKKNKHNQLERNKENARKQFLRKGEGTARFVGLARVNGKSLSKKSSIGTANATSLPKASLKLLPEPKPRGFKASVAARESPKDEIERINIKSNAYSSDRPIQAETEEMLVSHISSRSSTKPLAGNKMETSNRQLQQKYPQATPESSIEASFQKMLFNSQAREKIDDDELEEFELLEEAAADTSLSSNASVVVRMMTKATSNGGKPHNVTSSPIQKAGQQTGNGWEMSSSTHHYRGHTLAVNLEDSEDDDVRSIISDNSSPDVTTTNGVHTNGILDTGEQDELVKETVEFLDQSAWGDTTQQSRQTDEGDLTITDSPEKEPVTKPSVDRASPPPTSNLMKQFFPNLKKLQSRPKEILNAAERKSEKNTGLSYTSRSSFEAPDTDMSSQNQSEILKIKLIELDNEITKFKQENSTLEKLKLERELELAKLRSEVEQFQKQRSDELERIEKFKDEEIRKIKRERKLFEKYQKAARTIPNKKDRDEIETLQQQIEDLKDELKRRETRWNGSAARFRKRTEELENENFELKENLRLLEKERLQRWSKAEKQTKDTSQKSKLANIDSGGPSSRQNGVKNGLPKLESPRRIRSPQISSVEAQEKTSSEIHKHELSPRFDMIPQEQPPTPRTKPNVGLSIEKQAQRLSLTPERHNANQDKQDSEMRYPDGKVERILSNGSREITFPNGTRKTIDPTNQNVVISFFNGDMKQILPDEQIVYYYAESKTTHTTCKDGLEMFEFSNGQVEKHYPNGRKEIIFQDKTVKCIFVNGAEETVFADGTIQNLDVNGDRTISFPNGQREIHTQHYKRREYPDGTAKTVYQDGRQETRYASGRLRVKDPNGNVLVDTGIS